MIFTLIFKVIKLYYLTCFRLKCNRLRIHSRISYRVNHTPGMLLAKSFREIRTINTDEQVDLPFKNTGTKSLE
jgi:hypothetical protein